MSMDAPAPVLEPEKPAEAAPDAVVAAPACPAVEEAPNREICLRHDRNQAKKRCTCGKARRYRPGRGYQPPTENKALVQLVADGVEPVCASMRTHPGDVSVQQWGCRALGNVCTTPSNKVRPFVSAGQK